jgi:hypothetical protein
MPGTLRRLQIKDYRMPSLRRLMAVTALVFAGTYSTRAQCPSEVGDHPIAASPTRPAITDSAEVIQTGVVELESGWASGWPGGGVRQDSFGLLRKTCTRWDCSATLNSELQQMYFRAKRILMG